MRASFAIPVKAASAALLAAAAFLVGGRFAARPPGTPADLPKRHAFMMEKAFYDEAFAAERKPCPGPVAGAIVNHHLLPKAFIAEAVTCLDPETPLVVLIAPNHFSAGAGPALVSRARWITPYGELPPASEQVEALVRGGAVQVDETPFAKEHGIGNIVAFIRRATPDARILPIILKDAMKPEAVDALAESLTRIMPPDAAIVGSFDFSHELTPLAARHNDEKALDAILSGDAERASKLDIDSAPGLRLQLRLMERQGTRAFTLFRSSNSSEVLGKEFDDTTSYLTGVFSAGEPEPARVASFLAVGDVMLDRGVGEQVAARGLAAVLGQARRLLIGSDGVVANLESAVSDADVPDADPARPKFAIGTKILPALKARGFTHFSLANNHALDAGPEGLPNARQQLDRAGIRAFGDPGNRIALFSAEEVGGLQVAFVGYHAFSSGLEPVLEEVRRLDREVDAVVVTAHWGEEYRPTPNADQREAARALIAAGVDVILGAHPHVLQPVEVIDGRPVFYSLGNFLFDQPMPETRTGLAVGMALRESQMTFRLIPVEMEGGSLRLASQERRDTILKTLGYPGGEIIIPVSSYGRSNQTAP